MASGSSTLEIIFSAVDQTGGTINSITRGIRGLGDGVGAVTGPLASMADSILAVDAAIIALAASALAFAGNEAIEMEAALIDLEKVMDKSKDGSVSDYKQGLIDMAAEFGVTSTEVTNSAAAIKQAGFSMDGTMELLRQSSIAVNAADMDMDSATKMLISSLNGFQAEVGDAGKLLDIFNGISNNAATNVQNIGNSFKKTAPLAYQLGLSYEELASMTTVIIEAGNSGSEAGNALKTFMANMTKLTKQRTTYLEDELNIQTKVNGKQKDAITLIKEVQVKMKSLNKEEHTRAAAMLAGANQMSRIAPLLSNQARQYEILEIAQNSAGSAMEEFNTRTKSTEFALKRMKSAFGVAAIAMGDEYLAETKKVVEGTTSMFGAITEVTQGDNADKLFKVLRDAMSVFAREVEQLAVTLPKAFENVDLSGLISAFEKAGGTISNIFDIDTSDPESVQAAIQKIVDTLESLVRVTDGMVQEFDNFLDYVSGAVDEFNDLDDSTKESAGNILGIGKVVNEILPMIGSFADGIGAIGSGMQALALVGGAQTIATITSALGGLSSILSSIGPAMAVLGKGGLILGGVVAVVWGFAEAFDEVRIGLLEMGEAIGLVEDGTARSEVALLKRTEMLRKSFENQQPMIQQYIKDTGDMNVTIDNHHEKLQKWIKEKAKEAGVYKESNEQTKLSVDLLKETCDVMDESSDATAGAADAAEQLAESQKSVQSSLDGTIAKLGFTRKEIEALAFDEKLKLVELQIDINNDNLNRKLDLIKANMKGLQEMFSDTGDVIVDMFDQLGKEDGYNDQRLGFIDEEKKKREELFRLRLDTIKAAKDEVTAQKSVNMEAEDYNKLIEAVAESHAKKLGVSVDDVTGKVKELVDAQGEATGEVEKTAEALKGMSSEVYKAVFEFDIKRAEQQLKAFETALGSVDSTIGSTENVLLGVLDSVKESDSLFEKWESQEILEKEIEYREQAMKLQEELVEKQVEALDIQNKLAEAKADRFRSGDAMINIDGSGMSPALQTVLETIIEEAHIRASEEGAEYLLGTQ